MSRLATADPKVYDLDEVIMVTAQWSSSVKAVLNRMQEPQVRTDFCQCRLLKSQDLKGLLAQLDALRVLLNPPWSPILEVRKTRHNAAAAAIKDLLCEKEEVFEIPSDYGCLPKFTYKAWFAALNKLVSCKYWNIQVPEDGTGSERHAIFEDTDENSDSDPPIRRTKGRTEAMAAPSRGKNNSKERMRPARVEDLDNLQVKFDMMGMLPGAKSSKSSYEEDRRNPLPPHGEKERKRDQKSTDMFKQYLDIEGSDDEYSQ